LRRQGNRSRNCGANSGPLGPAALRQVHGDGALSSQFRAKGCGRPSHRRAGLVVALALSAAFLTLAPSALAAKSVVSLIGSVSPGELGGLFRTPRGPAVNQSGNGGVPAGTFYVLDSGNSRIQQFSPAGKFVAAWGWGVRDGEAEFQICKVASTCRGGTAGSGAGQLGSASQGIAIDQANGNVYISDQANRRIDVFKSTGAFEGAFGWGVLTGAASLQFCTEPTSCRAGISGAGAGQFNSTIGGLATDSSGNVYVADKSNRRVDVFKPAVSAGVVTGIEFVRAFGWGVDTNASAFQVCTTASTCNAGLGGNQAGQFAGSNSPSDLAIDSEGNIFALDSGNKRIQKFSSAPAVLNKEFGAAALASVFGTGERLSVAIVDDHLYVSGKRAGSSNKVAVAELNREGGLIDVHGTDIASTNANGLAVADPSLGGNVYVSTTNTVNGVYVLNEPPTIDPITIHGGTTATFSGAVISDGLGVSYHFEYSTDGEHWSSFPVPDASAGVSTAVAAISATGPGTGTLAVTARGGTFTLSFNGETTTTVPYNASAATVQAALEALPSIGAGNIAVSGGPGSPSGSSPYDIAFTGTLTGTEVTQISANPGDLDAPLIPVSQAVAGLTGAQLYEVRLVQSRPQAGSAPSSVVTFETDPAAPAISDTHASQATDTGATLTATLNPQNEETTYHFEVVSETEFAASGFANAIDVPAPSATTPAGGARTISKDVGNLQPDTTYRFRVVAANPTGSIVGEEATFTTAPSQNVEQDCPNSQLRVGPSASLPDCRAYELVSPADSNGLFPRSEIGGGSTDNFDTPLASTNGESVLFYTTGTLPGDQSNGTRAGYRSVRGEAGWTTQSVSPTGAQSSAPQAGGVSSDHLYAFWSSGNVSGSLVVGGQDAHYLRSPDGSFELIGQGSKGEDPQAWGRWITPNGSHVIFNTESGTAVQLEPDAPEDGIAAIYDRSADGPTHVVSLLPGNVTPTVDSEFRGVSEDGSAVVFTVEEKMYERRDNSVTLPIVEGEATFAGVSRNGDRVFYVKEGDAFACDVGTSGCGPSATAPTAIGSGGETEIVNVSADGSHVYFTSPQQLDGSEGEAGEPNLYAWDGSTVRFIGLLAPEDTEEFGSSLVRLGNWTELLNEPPTELFGPALNPSRTTPDGKILVFQSHADLTAYESGGHTEIYRYDAASETLDCISCNPLGTAAGSDAWLEATGATDLNPPTNALSHIANVTDDGEAVFFQTSDSLVPRDVNGTQDVYEWRAGRLALISTGLNPTKSYLYAMTGDGHDVFFTTNEALVSEDQNGGSRRIYDARVDGGFASSGTGAEACLGDACQGPPAGPPTLSRPGSSTFQGDGATPPQRLRCGKHRRRVKRRGKVRCVKRRHHRVNGHRGGAK
jgi:NHL repeat-containing protein